MPHKAKFRPIQLKDGSAWYVLYTPDKGPTEHIEGFYTEECKRRCRSADR